MADHLHKQIRDALVTKLTGLTTSGARVYANRLYPLDSANLPGLRISLVTFFSRHYIRPPRETYASKVDQAMIDRNGPRFARLVDRAVMDIATQHICRFSQYG